MNYSGDTVWVVVRWTGSQSGVAGKALNLSDSRAVDWSTIPTLEVSGQTTDRVVALKNLSTTNSLSNLRVKSSSPNVSDSFSLWGNSRSTDQFYWISAGASLNPPSPSTWQPGLVLWAESTSILSTVHFHFTRKMEKHNNATCICLLCYKTSWTADFGRRVQRSYRDHFYILSLKPWWKQHCVCGCVCVWGGGRHLFIKPWMKIKHQSREHISSFLIKIGRVRWKPFERSVFMLFPGLNRQPEVNQSKHLEILQSIHLAVNHPLKVPTENHRAVIFKQSWELERVFWCPQTKPTLDFTEVQSF